MAGAGSVIRPDDPGYRGQQHYTTRFLRIYDPLVIGFFSRFVWRCPAARLVGHYNRHLRARHLDVGPGTGWFLERAELPAEAEVTLADPNPDVLAHASRRLGHLAPTVLAADVRQPLPTGRRYDSAALNFVLHCLPGPMAAKTEAVRNTAAVLEPDGRLFGATVLGTPTLHTPLSRAAMRANNRKGIFSNLEDSEDGLRGILDESFATVGIEIVGTVAVFAATGPRSPGA